MNVVWLNHRDPEHPRAGGAERTIFEVGRRLVHRGHQVTVVAAAWPGAPLSSTRDGVRFVRSGRRFRPHLAGLRAIVRETPDVVVDDLAHAMPWATPWFTGAPTVVFFRHLHARTLPGQVSGPAARLLALVERRYAAIYPHARFVVESPSSLQDLVRLGVASGRIDAIPPGVDLERFVPGVRSPDPLGFYFGGYRRYKRPETTLDLLDRLAVRGRACRFAFAGATVVTSGLGPRVRRSPAASAIRFLGRLDDVGLAAALGTSWFNVHASIAEGWCLSAMEAAACGVPTIGYDVPGLRDSVDPGRSGLLVPDGDIEALADAAGVVLDAPDHWPRMCRTHAERFTWDRAAVGWEDALQRAASRSASTPGAG